MANLAGSGCRSENSLNPERGLHPPLSDPAKTHKVSHSHKLLCQSPEEQLPFGGITSAYRQKCSGASKEQNVPELFQQTVFSPKTKQVETYLGSEQSEFLSQDGEIQNGDTRNHQDIPPTRGVGHLNRLQGCLFPHTNTGTIQEISEISCPGSNLPIQSFTFRSVNSTLGVHYVVAKEVKLVGESRILPGLSPAYSRTGKNMPKIRLAGEFGQVGTGTQADL